MNDRDEVDDRRLEAVDALVERIEVLIDWNLSGHSELSVGGVTAPTVERPAESGNPRLGGDEGGDAAA